MATEKHLKRIERIATYSKDDLLALKDRISKENKQHYDANRDKILGYKKKYREQKGDEWEAVSRTSQLRYNSNEKTTIVDGKTSIIKETIDQIESQIQFYQDTIKTVDAALFGTKTRLDIEKMLGV